MQRNEERIINFGNIFYITKSAQKMLAHDKKYRIYCDL